MQCICRGVSDRSSSKAHLNRGGYKDQRQLLGHSDTPHSTQSCGYVTVRQYPQATYDPDQNTTSLAN
jgi:hypothetical protein